MSTKSFLSVWGAPLAACALAVGLVFVGVKVINRDLQKATAVHAATWNQLECKMGGEISFKSDRINSKIASSMYTDAFYWYDSHGNYSEYNSLDGDFCVVKDLTKTPEIFR